MESEKNRRRLTTLLLVVAILIMMVQNYFLLKKNGELVNKVEQLNEHILRQTVMQSGDPVLPFTAITVDSTYILIDPTVKKKKLFLVFTTWCGACLQNMPEWTGLLKEIRHEKVDIVGLSPDPPTKIKEYHSRLSLPFPVYSTSNDSTIMKKYKMLSVPQTILVDSSGYVIKVWPGILSDDAKQEIKKDI